MDAHSVTIRIVDKGHMANGCFQRAKAKFNFSLFELGDGLFKVIYFQ